MGIRSGSIGRYKIQEVIGAGTNGLVFRCFDPILKRNVAVKVPSDGLDDEHFKAVVESFVHEAEIGAQFQHTNIVTIYDVGSDTTEKQSQDDSYRGHFLVMGLAKGIDLKHYLEKHGQLPVEETLNIIFECCKALDYIHFKGILHRDIKPANIIYDPKLNSVKLTDFSISNYEDDCPADKRVGTLPYFSPEHFIDGQKLSFQSDIFALGSMMYQLLTGVCPFQGENVDEVASKIVSSSPRPIRDFRDDVPTQVEFIVVKAMSKSTRDRFQNAVEFTDAVSLALNTIGVKRMGEHDSHRKGTAIDEYLMLRNSSWFSGFSPQQIDELVRSGSVLSYEPGEDIFSEGDLADSFFTLLEGEAEVIKEGKIINQLLAGACFGELGHLTKASKRVATIRAKTSVRVLSVKTNQLLYMSAESQAEFYKAFLIITMERLIEKNVQFVSTS